MFDPISIDYLITKNFVVYPRIHLCVALHLIVHQGSYSRTRDLNFVFCLNCFQQLCKDMRRMSKNRCQEMHIMDIFSCYDMNHFMDVWHALDTWNLCIKGGIWGVATHQAATWKYSFWCDLKSTWVRKEWQVSHHDPCCTSMHRVFSGCFWSPTHQYRIKCQWTSRFSIGLQPWFSLVYFQFLWIWFNFVS